MAGWFNWLKKWWRSRTVHLGGGLLCDSCKLNYGNVCNRPERPNAKSCPDYLPK